MELRTPSGNIQQLDLPGHESLLQISFPIIWRVELSGFDILCEKAERISRICQA